MPVGEPKHLEALFRFVRRVTICSEMRDAFTGDKFDGAFAVYHARDAISESDREKLKKLMSDGKVVQAMKTINEALHGYSIKPGVCSDTDYQRKPYRYGASMLVALAILLASGGMMISSFMDVGRTGPFVCGIVGAFAGLVVLWDAVSHQGL